MKLFGKNSNVAAILQPTGGDEVDVSVSDYDPKRTVMVLLPSGIEGLLDCITEDGERKVQFFHSGPNILGVQKVFKSASNTINQFYVRY